LHEQCVGSISEIYDGDPPHEPKGAISQAWGVGELLRIRHLIKTTAKQTKTPNALHTIKN